MSTLQKLDAAREALAWAPYALRAVYVNHTAIDAIYQEKRKALASEILNHPNPIVGNGNANLHPVRLLMMPVIHEHASIKSALDFLEATEQWADAVKIVQPLVDEVARLEILLADELQAAARIEQARMDALEAAKAEAVAEIEARFAVAVIPAPATPELFRGKFIRKNDA